MRRRNFVRCNVACNCRVCSRRRWQRRLAAGARSHFGCYPKNRAVAGHDRVARAHNAAAILGAKLRAPRVARPLVAGGNRVELRIEKVADNADCAIAANVLHDDADVLICVA